VKGSFAAGLKAAPLKTTSTSTPPEQWMAVDGIGQTGARQVADLLDAKFDSGKMD